MPLSRIPISFLFIFSLATSLASQMDSVSFEQLDRLQKVKPKHVVVFLHTDWCRYCKRMEKSTFRNDEVTAALKSNFYFIPFAAESEASVAFAGRTFHYLPQGRNTGVHELALLLGKDESGRLSYPTLVILSPANEILFRYSGYLGAAELLKVLSAVCNSEP